MQGCTLRKLQIIRFRNGILSDFGRFPTHFAKVAFVGQGSLSLLRREDRVKGGTRFRCSGAGRDRMVRAMALGESRPQESPVEPRIETFIHKWRGREGGQERANYA